MYMPLFFSIRECDLYALGFVILKIKASLLQ